MCALASQSLEVCAPIAKDLLVPQRVIPKWVEGSVVCTLLPLSLLLTPVVLSLGMGEIEAGMFRKWRWLKRGTLRRG